MAEGEGFEPPEAHHLGCFQDNEGFAVFEFGPMVPFPQLSEDHRDTVFRHLLRGYQIQTKGAPSTMSAQSQDPHPQPLSAREELTVHRDNNTVPRKWVSTLAGLRVDDQPS